MEPVYCCAKLLTAKRKSRCPFPPDGEGEEEVSLHCIHLTFFGLFSVCFGLIRNLSALPVFGQHNTTQHAYDLQVHACACKSASSACWHFSCGHWAEGTQYWLKPPTIVQVRITMQLFWVHDGYYLQFAWSTW